jgi:small subunit ribosomal protein S16
VAAKIRLMRLGKMRSPHYRVVVADSRTKRDGRVIETIGKYHPKEEPSFIEIDGARAMHWLKVGAQPTEAVEALLKVTGTWQEFKGLPAPPPMKVKEAKADKKATFEAAAKAAAEAPAEEKPKAKKAAPKAEASDEAAAPGTPTAETATDAAEAPAAEAPAAEDAAAEEPAAEAPAAETTEASTDSAPADDAAATESAEAPAEEQGS